MLIGGAFYTGNGWAPLGAASGIAFLNKLGANLEVLCAIDEALMSIPVLPYTGTCNDIEELPVESGGTKGMWNPQGHYLYLDYYVAP